MVIMQCLLVWPFPCQLTETVCLCPCSEREKLLGMSAISFITIFFLTRCVCMHAYLRVRLTAAQLHARERRAPRQEHGAGRLKQPGQPCTVCARAMAVSCNACPLARRGLATVQPPPLRIGPGIRPMLPACAVLAALADGCSVGTVFFSALSLSVAVIAAHGAFREPDNLFLDADEVSRQGMGQAPGR